jgi:RNA polymerase sigma factor (sigma-70 family)
VIPLRPLGLEEEQTKPQGFEAFFRGSFARVSRVAGRIAGPEGGEDAAVEALARAYARWGRVSRMDDAEAWVIRVATNLALDQVRKKVAYAEPPRAIEVESTVVSEQVLREAVLRLPRRQREAVTLRYLADLPEAEVAEVLGVSPGSVKTHLHRALASMRVSLSTDERGETSVAGT